VNKRKFIIYCPSDDSAGVKLDQAPYPCDHSESMAIAKTHTVLGRGRTLEHNGWLLGLSTESGNGECLLLGEGGDRIFPDTWSAAEWFVENA
jgi:hypothetical protein